LKRLSKIIHTISLNVLLVLMVSCFRGGTSEKPPIHLNPNMDNQPKYKAQAESNFFVDGRTMRMPIEGTVAQDELFADKALYFGKKENGGFVKASPVSVDDELLARGGQRYNIYCAPCHNTSGDGKGIIISKGFLPPPNFHQDKYRQYPDGQIYDVISNGFRNMPSYKHQIPVHDRWAITGFVRALQKENKTEQNLSTNTK
jgi:mono/diheme cytochrome c family protein